MVILLYTLGVLSLTVILVVFAYLDRIYRELGRVTAGRVHEHLLVFESEIEPRLHMERSRAALAFNLLARLWLALVASVTAVGVVFFVPGTWEVVGELLFLLCAEVAIGTQLVPLALLATTRSQWLSPLVPGLRLGIWITWPIHAALNLSVSALRLTEEEPSEAPTEQQAIEALVDAATEEGIIEQDDARLIEQVVEFGDKRVRDVMTPRPDVVAIPARATLEELGERIVETKFSRLPVYENSIDDVIGIVVARDMLAIPDTEAVHRTVRELVRPALFVPQTKFGSELLKEMQQKNQQMAVVIDEYGSLAGVVTIEDLIEEIVGEIGEEDRRPAPDVVREAGGTMVLRGSVPVDKVGELFGIQLEPGEEYAQAATVAGLLNSVAGHVPRTGEEIEFDGLRFEVLEANQRKVLRVRARRTTAGAASTARTL
jgi:putative hemolysin